MADPGYGRALGDLWAFVELVRDGEFYTDYDEACAALGRADAALNLLASRELGKADWMYDDEYEMHVPCCSQPKWNRRCGNGPLTGTAIRSGNCGEDHNG